MKKGFLHIIILLLLIWSALIKAQQRFPRPDFESGYVYPEYQFLSPRNPAWEYIDVMVLLGALCIITFFALYKRSRQGLIWTSVFSLAYFGFFRKGCICAVGSVQNISLALFNDGYTLPLSTLLFFLLPLLFTLVYGRVFCAGVCPFGAIQELIGIQSVNLPRKIETILSTVPYLYLGLAVLYAATDSQFIICKYDPFVGIFRLNATAAMIIFGILLLITGVFINRPYCRFLCPYGVLLNWFSRFSYKHLSITPTNCINCRLCEDSCPSNAILPSNINTKKENKGLSRRRFFIYLVLIPVFLVTGCVLFHSLSRTLSYVNKTVRLAKEIRMETELNIPAISQQAIIFKESGKTIKELYEGEEYIVKRFKKASGWLGSFFGISLGIALLSLSARRERQEYKPHKGKCYSCGRCFEYCPVPNEKNNNQ